MHQAAAEQEILSRGWVQQLQWFAEIDSTNATARRALQSNAAYATPALLIADRQTAGRGRSNRTWWSPTGCLMLTLVLPGEALPSDSSLWSQLALVCGQAVAQTAANALSPESLIAPPIKSIPTSTNTSPRREVQLKWPNDVYANQRKLAGILIESAAAGHWLIGIGLNVNIDWRQAPEEVASKATCLSSLAGRPLELSVILVELMEELQNMIAGWRAGDGNWLTHWREHCLLTGRVVHIRLAPDRELIGVCEGLDATGRLIVRDENSVQFLSAGEVIGWQ